MSTRTRAIATIVGTLAVVAAIAIVGAGQGAQFTKALRSAPLGILGLAAGLQLVALVARSEAWHACVRATGATVERRRLFRAASVGYLTMIANGQLGVAARIAVLRRTAPHECPRVPALIAAEVPILAVEGVLAAMWSFTLVGPLGLPWWPPVVAFAVLATLTVALCALARRRRAGLWSGLAVLRTLNGRSRVIGLVLLAVVSQILRNWLILRATGTPVSLLDSIAVLISIVVLSQLPVGPSVGAGATVLILGSHGVAAVAAAGVLLTATGTAGALVFAAWALADRLRPSRKRVALRPALAKPLGPPVPAAAATTPRG